MAKAMTPAEFHVVQENTMRTKDGPPTLWEWLANHLREDNVPAAMDGMRRYGLPPRPASYHSMTWALLDRQLHLLNDPSLNVNEPVGIAPIPGLSGSYSMPPLHHAASSVQRNLFAWLVEHGANPNVPNDLGETVWDLLDRLIHKVQTVKARTQGVRRHSTQLDQTFIALRTSLVVKEQSKLREVLDEVLSPLVITPPPSATGAARQRARL